MGSYKIDASNRILFAKDMKIAELIDASSHLLALLLRLDIQLPFGDYSVEDLCQRHGMSAETFLLLCRIYVGEEFEPEAQSLPRQDLPYLLRYLRASHNYYLQEALPAVERGVERVLESCDKRQSLIVRKFYEDYADEVRSHLDYEERTIFPYVEGVLHGRAGERGMSKSMECHTDICDKVDDIKSIIIKYLPESCPTQVRCDLLVDLFGLRDDLVRHTLIEVKVLTPMVVALEKEFGL